MKPEDKKDLIHDILNKLHDLNDTYEYDEDDLHEAITTLRHIDYEHAKKHSLGMWSEELR